MRARLPMIFTTALLATSLPATATAVAAPWTPVTPALVRPDNLDPAQLSDVAAVSPTDVWAVGGGWRATEGPLIAHWTGAGWDPVEEPHVPDAVYTLSAVDAVSARDVWAIGNRRPSATDVHPAPVIAHYDDTEWSTVPVPAPPRWSYDTVTDIDMVSATDGWAVGWHVGPSTEPYLPQPLVLRWRDGRWARTVLPGAGDADARLMAVHARAGDDVWAVGMAGDSALVMHFDGTRWTRIAVPHSGVIESYNGLRAVTAVSAGEVWAVGSACVPAPNVPACQPSALRLSGGVWRSVPTSGDRGTNLTDVVVRSSDDVWAVGYEAGPLSPLQEASHVEHWDGQRFTTVPVAIGPLPTRGGLASALAAITRIPGSAELWAVGWQHNVPLVIRHG